MLSLLFSLALGAPDLTSDQADIRAQSLMSLERDALAVARDGGDGERWLALGLAEAGLAQMTIRATSTVPGFPAELQFSACSASNTVRCDELEHWDPQSDAQPTLYKECSGDATLTCTTTVASAAESAQDILLRCGGVTARGRAEVGQPVSLPLDGCVRSGAVPILELATPVDSGSRLGNGADALTAFGGEFGSNATPIDWEHNAAPIDWERMAGDLVEQLEGGRLGLADRGAFGEGTFSEGAYGDGAFGEVPATGGGGGGGRGDGLGVGRMGGGYTPPQAGPRWTRAETVGTPFGPDGMKVAIAGDVVVGAVREQLLFFDLQTGETRSEHALVVGAGGRRVNDVCASSDGRYAAIVAGSPGLDTRGGGYSLWALGESPTEVLSEERGWSVQSCVFAGEFLAVWTREGVEVWDVQRSVLRRTLQGDAEYGGQLDTVRLLAGHPSQAVVAVQKDEAIHTVDLRTGEWAKVADYSGFPLDAEWVEDDVLVLADHLDDTSDAGTVLLSLSDGTTRQWMGDRLNVAAAPGLLIVGTPRGAVAIDPATGAKLGAVFEGVTSPHDVSVSADGTWAVQTTRHGPASRVRINPVP